jgi:hypothetical protein
MPLDQAIIDILNEQARTFNQTQTNVEARASNGTYDHGRFCFYDIQLFPRTPFSGKHILRVSHASPGPSFPVEITFADPVQPSKDVTGSPEVLAERVRAILANETTR